MKNLNLVITLIFISLLFTFCSKEDDASLENNIEANFEIKYITADSIAPCKVEFINNSLNSASYSWNFGDGNFSGEENPTHIFENGGMFSVKLIASGDEFSKEVTKEIKIKEFNIENPNPPLNNSSIVYQSINDLTNTTITKLIEFNSELFFIGRNTNYCPSSTFGKLNNYGSSVWTKMTGYKTFDICTNDDYIFIAGGLDNDGSNTSGYDYEQGRISVYNTNGTLIDDLTLEENDYKIHLRSITYHNPIWIHGAGVAINNSGVVFPYIVDISFEDNVLAISSSKIYTDYPNVVANSIDYANYEVDNGRSAAYIICGNKIDSDYRPTNITVIKLLVGDFADTDTWQVDVIDNAGLKSSCLTNSMFTTSDPFMLEYIYVVGETEAIKEPFPSDNSKWKNGFVACIDKSGTIKWKKSINISTKSDSYSRCFVSEDYLYAVGEQSIVYYSTNSSNRQYGNGLISKIQVDNGNVISNMTIGDAKYHSGINSCVLSNNSLYCGGYTNQQYNSQNKVNYNSWFVITNP